jgi:hypothetical protein
MQRTQALPRPMVSPAVAVATALFLVLVAGSVVVQPPRAGGSDPLLAGLAWVQAVFFSAGLLTFVVALLSIARGGFGGRLHGDSGRAGGRPAATGTGFTLIAIGGTPDDMRAITDAGDAAAAVAIMAEWSSAHPGEHIVVFGADGEPVAFRRPSAFAGVAVRGAA